MNRLPPFRGLGSVVEGVRNRPRPGNQLQEHQLFSVGHMAWQIMRLSYPGQLGQDMLELGLAPRRWGAHHTLARRNRVVER